MKSLKQQDMCEICRHRLLSQGRDGNGKGQDKELSRHLESCPDCASFARTVRKLEKAAPGAHGHDVDDAIFESVYFAVQKEMWAAQKRRAREKTGIWIRLISAAALCLPVIVAMNTMFAWLVNATVGAWLSSSLATVAVLMIAAFTLLGISLIYGSIPLVAGLAFRLRSRTILSQEAGFVIPAEAAVYNERRQS